MNLDTDENHARVILDTNVLISAIGFGGNPRKILLLTIKKKIRGVISKILLAELHEVILKKFPRIETQLLIIEKQIKDKFIIVEPRATLSIIRDEDDNRVLEAAVEGNCNFIVTGDKDLLELAKYKNIKIIRPSQFLDMTL